MVSADMHERLSPAGEAGTDGFTGTISRVTADLNLFTMMCLLLISVCFYGSSCVSKLQKNVLS